MVAQILQLIIQRGLLHLSVKELEVLSHTEEVCFKPSNHRLWVLPRLRTDRGQSDPKYDESSMRVQQFVAIPFSKPHPYTYGKIKYYGMF